MKITAKTHRMLRLQSVIFYLLLLVAIVLIARLSMTFNHQFDWTQNSRNTLSETSQQLLQDINSPVTVQVFAGNDYPYLSSIKDLLARYQAYTDQLKIDYIDPQFSPDLVRAMNIQQQGEIVISRGERKQHVQDLSEQSFTNALIAVARSEQPWLVFTEGHQERSLFEQNNVSLSNWAQQLQSKGFKLQALNLLEQKAIPDNTRVLVIASPLQDFLPGEIKLLRDYLDKGGNLLWLADPKQPASLNALAESLGLEISAKTVLDPNAAMLGINDPRFVLISDYANHPIGQATTSVSLFAEATTVEKSDSDTALDWQYTNLLNSQPDAWLESNSVIQSNVALQAFDAGIDQAGPLSLAYALSRELDGRQQRVVVIGDGDFVSNAYLGNVGNLSLAMATMNWLSHDDALINIPVKTSVGTQLTLNRTQSAVIGFGFLVILPLLFVLAGLTIWWRRRRR